MFPLRREKSGRRRRTAKNASTSSSVVNTNLKSSILNEKKRSFFFGARSLQEGPLHTAEVYALEIHHSVDAICAYAAGRCGWRASAPDAVEPRRFMTCEFVAVVAGQMVLSSGVGM